MPTDIGPKMKVAVLEAAKDDLAVEVSLWMKRNGVRLRDLRRDYGVSQRRLREISLWLRGAPQSRIGHVGALQLAERIGVPTEVVTGEEALAFREFRAQREAGMAVAA